MGRLEDFAEKERIGVLVSVSMTERLAEILVTAAVGAHLAQHFSWQARNLNKLPDHVIVLPSCFPKARGSPPHYSCYRGRARGLQKGS